MAWTIIIVVYVLTADQTLDLKTYNVPDLTFRSRETCEPRIPEAIAAFKKLNTGGGEIVGACFPMLVNPDRG